MKRNRGTLFFFCGKMGAGKTTMAGKLAHKKRAILLSEDRWLYSLYPDTIASIDDYVHYSGLIKPPVKELVQSILKVGVDVVMDFPANTTRQREWFRTIFDEIGAHHQLLYLQVSDELCVQRVKQRAQEQPERAATDTVEMFHEVTRYFAAPTEEEGFTVTVIDNRQE